MASRYEDRRNARGGDREEDEGWGNISRGQGRGSRGRSDYERGEGRYGRDYEEGRGEYRNFGRDPRGSSNDRDDYGSRGRDFGRGEGGFGGGYSDMARNRSGYSDDLSGGGMYGGGMGGYSGGGYQGYTGGMNNYGGANYGGGRESYSRDQERGDRYQSDYPSTERGYMTDRERGGGQQDRGWFERASDEVASWFGDDEAERRRDTDARQGGQHRGRGPRNYTRSDDRIRDDINDRLTDHDYLDASDIVVEVNVGEVVLTGTVDHRSAKRLAEDIAEDVSGVRNVENRIRINQERSGMWGSTSSATDPGASAATGTGMSGSTGDTGLTTGTTTGATGGTSGTSGTIGKTRGKAA